MNLHTDSASVVEDPESYAVYIARQANRRKMEEDKTNKISTRAGSGKVWNNKPRKYDFNYDYRQHQISKGIKKCATNRVKLLFYFLILQYSTANSFNKDITERQNQTAKEISKAPLDRETYYDYIYNGHSNAFTETCVQKTSEVDTSFVQKRGLLKMDKDVDFGHALGLLHNHLYSFDLAPDEI